MPREWTLEEFYGINLPAQVTPQEAQMTGGEIGQAGKYLVENAPEIVGGVAGSFVPGGFLAKAVGSTLGTAGGKTLEQYIKSEELTPFSNIGLAATEEALATLGLAGAKGLSTGFTKAASSLVGADAASKITDVVKSTLLPSRTKRIKKGVEENLISSSDIAATEVPLVPRNIAEAQTQELGERFLTTFEETGGKLASRQQARLANEAKIMQQYTQQRPEWFKAREANINKLRKNITGNTPLEKIDSALFQSVKDEISLKEKVFSDALSKIDQNLIATGKGVNINTQNFLPEFAPFREQFRVKLGRNGEQIFDAIVDNFKARSKGNGSTMTANDLRSFQADIEDVVGKFKPTADVQDKAIAIPAKAVNDILKKSMELTKNAPMGQTKAAQEYFANWQKFADLAEAKSDYLNNPLIKKLGAKEYVQEGKSAKPQDFIKIVSDNPSAYSLVKNIFNTKPDVMQKINNNIRASFVEKYYKPSFGASEAGFDINNIIKDLSNPDKVSLLKEIGGEKLLNSLYNSAIIQKGLNSSMPSASRQISPLDQVTENLMSVGVTNIEMGKIPLLAALSGNTRKLLGINISDKEFYEAIKGEKGQRLITRMSGMFLDDPQSFALARELLKEAGKAGKAYNEAKREKELRDAFIFGQGALINAQEKGLQTINNEQQ